MQEEVKKTVGDIKEVVTERFYSPMYFYFIIAWVITNWKFVYILLFVNQELTLNEEGVSKINLLIQTYPFDSLWNSFWSFAHLVIIPAAFSYVAVWWFTILSEKFYEKYENHKQNKRVIQRELEYTEKVRFAKLEREIRDMEFDKNNIKYEDNKEFNEAVDASNEMVSVNKILMTPSEVLYKNDYEAYKEALAEWLESRSIESLTDKQKQEVLDEYAEDQRGRQEVNEWKDYL